MKIKISLFFVFISFLGCDEKRIYDHYIELKPNTKWHKDSLIYFKIENKDTIQTKNLFINIRNNHEYKYNNLFLIAKITKPNQEAVIDTLEYLMAYPDGRFIGQKSSNVIENKLYFKKNYIFDQIGKYDITLGQANRELGTAEGIQHLEGITEVGFRIEKTK